MAGHLDHGITDWEAVASGQTNRVEIVATGERGRLLGTYETPTGKIRVRILRDSGKPITFPLWSAKWIER